MWFSRWWTFLLYLMKTPVQFDFVFFFNVSRSLKSSLEMNTFLSQRQKLVPLLMSINPSKNMILISRCVSFAADWYETLNQTGTIMVRSGTNARPKGPALSLSLERDAKLFSRAYSHCFRCFIQLLLIRISHWHTHRVMP